MIFTPLLFSLKHICPASPQRHTKKSLSICKNIQTAAEVQPSFVIKKGTTFSAVPIVLYVSFFVVTTGHDYFIC